jgi:trk system potassium uptake protein
MGSKILADFSPSRVIVSSLCCTVLLGTLLLALPFARTVAVPFLDLLFTATSITCVTGLFTIPLSSFNFFGHCILLMLMEIGSLGLITMSLFFIYFLMNVGFTTQLMAGQLLEIDSWKNIRSILIFIIVITITVQMIGAACLLPVFMTDFPMPYALFLAIFHAASTFCNSGIWLVDNPYAYANNMLLLGVMSFLILVGDIGFITWYELKKYAHKRIVEHKNVYISLHSKIVIYGSLTVIFISTVLFMALEWNNVLAPFTWPVKVLSSFFHANSMRSTGIVFNNMHEFHPATALLMMIVGFIGSSPFSTGSGIKITTMVVFLATIRAAINGRIDVELRSRCIPIDQVNKATAIISLSIAWIIMSAFVLLILQPGASYLFFEAVMAFSNVGISSGTSATLTAAGKLLMIVTMMIGRIGSLTLILALTFRKKKKLVDFSYAEERVMLG